MFRRTYNNIIYGIRNIFRWMPTIWRDRHWDGWYIYKILYRKLKLNAKDFEKANIFVGVEHEVRKMRLCCNLLKRLMYDDYCLSKQYDLLKEINIRKAVEYEIGMRNQDKKLLFKLIERNIGKWWD